MDRRGLQGILLLVAVVLAGMVGQAPATTARTTAARAVAEGGVPLVNVAAFRGQGALAFAWNDRAYLLDGAGSSLRELPGGAITDFTWSPDGRWLAYLDRASPTDPAGLRVVRADGADAHLFVGLPAPAASLTWQPASDALLVTLSGTTPTAQHLWRAAPTGGARMVAAATPWGLPAPNGRTLAYALTLPFRTPETRSDALYTIPMRGGRPTRLLLAQHAGITLAGWWPDGKGLLFWLDPLHSASLAADGLGLYTLPLGGTPRLLTHALPRGLSFSPSGRQVLLMGGSGRELWHGKMLTICDVATAACHVLQGRPGAVALDPAWSPTGTSIAFVQAQDRGSRTGAFGFTTTQALRAWVQTHTLWIATPAGTHARALPAGTGVYGPQWSGDGRHLLFIRDNALWLIATRGGPPARIVGPFPGTADLFGFYGAPSWPITFAWNHRGTRAEH